jgi:hypothetical protein
MEHREALKYVIKGCSWSKDVLAVGVEMDAEKYLKFKRELDQIAALRKTK